MGVWDEASVGKWRKQHIKVCKDNAPSVFCEDLLFTPTENQARKAFHKKEVQEHLNMLILRGADINREIYA